jgi:hypothetical protein
MSLWTRGDDTTERELRELPSTEPEVIAEISVTGMTVRRYDNSLKFVGWATVLDADGTPEERRIVVRFAMCERDARQFRADMIDAYKTAN